MTDLITTLERQEQELVFESFDHTDAWRQGSRITAIAQQAGATGWASTSGGPV
jgi:uncharacterized protein (UPF0303 family)